MICRITVYFSKEAVHAAGWADGKVFHFPQHPFLFNIDRALKKFNFVEQESFQLLNLDATISGEEFLSHIGGATYEELRDHEMKKYNITKEELDDSRIFGIPKSVRLFFKELEDNNIEKVLIEIRE